MVGAHQNLNGSRDLTGMICHLCDRICSKLNLPTRLEVSNSIHYEHMKRDTKCGKWGGLGLLVVIQGPWK